MNRILDMGRRAYETIRNNRAELALGVLGLAGVGITAHATEVDATIYDGAQTDAAIVMHRATGEWPSWTPEGVKPVTDMTGTEISEFVSNGAAVDTTQLDRSEGFSVVIPAAGE